MRVKCQCCLGVDLFELETCEGILTIKCSKCGTKLDSKYVKEEMLYFSKREGYRNAYDEMNEFVDEKRRRDMVR